MAKYSNTVEYNITTKLDASGISKLQTEIRQVENELREMSNYNLINPAKAEQAKKELTELRHLINSSFNSQLGMFDLTAFTKGMKNAGKSVKSLSDSFSLVGSKGQMAFNSLIGRIGQIDTGIKSMSSTTNKIATTLGNTVRWGMISTAFQSVLTSAHDAARYVSDLDESLTNIMMVTDYSRENMNDFAKSANEAAKALGSTTTAYTDATLVFAQQGYDIPQSQELANMSIKLANVSQQDSATTSDQITAYMNAYNMDQDMNKLNNALGAWAQVANDSAADVEELATATQKSASTANTVGVSMDQLNATIATIESVTKDAPENIGNGLKTIYARFSDIKMGETLDDGVNLGQVTGALSKVGVNALDENGNMKDVGNILEELMDVWGQMDQTQKAAIATTLAGKYQLSRFEALMNRSDLYKQYLSSSENADASNMEEMYDDYLNSMEGKMKTLQSTIEGLFTNLFDTDDLYGFIEGLTSVVDLLGKMTQSLGDGKVLLTGLGAIATRTFSNQIGQAAGNFVKNIQSNQLKKNNQSAAKGIVNQLGLVDDLDGKNKDIVSFAEKGLNNSSYMSKEQQEQYNNALRETVELTNTFVQQEKELDDAVLAVNVALGEQAVKVVRTDDGNIQGLDTSGLKSSYGNEAILKSGSDLKEAQLSLDAMSSMAFNASSEMTNLENTLEKSALSADSLKTSYENLRKELEQVSSDDAKKLENAFNDLNKYIENNTLASKEGQEALVNYRNELNRIGDAADKSAKHVKALDLSEQVNNAMNTQEALSTRKIANKGMEKGWDTQKTVSQIANVTGAIGQMSFAWQSFQSLGSIWDNTDITTGEKIQQTIMNLSMSLPMFINSLNGISRGKIGENFSIILDEVSGKNKVKIEEISKEIEIASQKEVEATNRVIAAEKAAEQAQRQHTEAVREYQAIVNGKVKFTNPLKQDYTQFKDPYQKVKESQENVVKTQKKLSEAQKDAASATSVYNNACEKGSSVTGKFSGAVKGLLKSLLPLLAITAVFEGVTYIMDSIEKERQSVIETGKEAAESSKEISSLTTSYNELYNQLQEGQDVSSDLKSSANDLAESLDSERLKVLAATGQWEKYNKELDKATKKKNIENNLDILNSLEAQESDLQVSKNVKTMTAGYGMTAASADNGASYYNDETKKAYDSIAQLKYAKNELSEAYSELSDEYEKLSSIEKNSEYGKKLAEDLAETKERYDNVTKSLNQNKEAVKEYEELLEQYAENVISITEKDPTANKDVLYESGTSLTDYYNKLRESSEYQAIYQKLGESAAETYLKSFTNKMASSDIDGSEELLKKLEESTTTYELDERSQKKLNRTSEKKSTIHEWATTGNDAIDSNKLEEYVSLTNEQIDSSEELNDRQKELAKSYKDISEGQEKANKTAKKIVKGYNELAQSYDYLLSVFDGGEGITEGSEAWQEAIKTAKKGYKDLLNLSDDVDLSDEFVSSEKNLETFKEALNGSTEKYEELQKAAAEDILMQVGLDDEQATQKFQQDLDYVRGYDSPVFGNIADLEVGASLNDEGFLQGLTDMVNASGMSAKEAQAYLANMGVDANVITKPVQTTDTHTWQVPKWGKNSEGYTTFEGFETKTSTDTAQTTGTALEVTSATKSSGGNVTVSGGGGGGGGSSASPKSTGGSGGGGGGGGGGKSSTIEDDTKKEIDIYQEVNEELERIQSSYDKASEYADRLYGKNKISAIENLIKKEREHADVLQQKLSIQQKELETLSSSNEDINGNKTLYSYLGDSGFDEYGAVVQSVYEAKYNELYNKIKSFEGKDEESNKDAYEAAKEDLENFTSALDAWYSALNQRDELIQELDNTWYTMQDSAADVIEEFYDLQDRLKDLNETINDINKVNNWLDNGGPGKVWSTDIKDALGDLTTSFDSIYEALNGEISVGELNLAGNNAKFWDEEYQKAYGDSDTAKAYQDAVTKYLTLSEDLTADLNDVNDAYNAMLAAAETAGLTSGVGLSEADLMDNLKEAVENYTEALENQKDLVEDLWGSVEDELNTIDDQIDRQIDSFDKVTDRIDTQMDMVELLYGETAYSEKNALLQQQNESLFGKVSDIAVGIETTKKVLDKLKENGQDDTELYQEQMDKLNDYQDQMLDTQQSIADNVKNIYENMVNQTLNNWSGDIFGLSDLDWYETQWDLITRNSEQYLDDVNRAFEIQKLQSQYNTLLDDTNDLSIQQKITNQMQQQLDYLREKTNLSAYDVAYAQAQLEILQKQIALEEAQANKSQMKLKRDTQGNYKYVYTAKEGDVKSAQDDLLEAQNNAYNLSKDALIENQENAVQAVQDAKAKLLEVMTDASLSAEDRAERIQYIIAKLKEYLSGMSEDIGEISNNLLADVQQMGELLLEENEGNLTQILEKIVNGNENAWKEIDDRFDTSVLNAFTKFDKMEERTDEMYNNLLDSMDEYEDGIASALDITGDNLDDYVNNALSDAFDATKDLLEVSNELFDTLQQRATEVFNASDAVSAYTATLNATNASYQETINNLKKELQAANDQISAYQAEKKRQEEEAAAKAAAASSGGGGGASLTAGSMIGFNGRYYADSWGGGSSGSMYSGRAGAVRISRYSGTPYGYQSNHGSFAIHIETPSGGPLGWIKPSQAFDTGGYTGEWNDSGVDGKGGRVAILHQKELVLNNTQTEYILKAAELVSQMTNSAMSIAGNNMLGKINQTSGDTIEQRVQIDATFPAAESANEIKQALESLADSAYQYANRKY